MQANPTCCCYKCVVIVRWFIIRLTCLNVCLAQIFLKFSRRQQAAYTVRGMKREDWPLWSVPEAGDVWRYIPPRNGAVESRVQRVQWLKHVERGWIGVEHLTKERWTTALISQDNHRLWFVIHELMKWRLDMYRVDHCSSLWRCQRGKVPRLTH